MALANKTSNQLAEKRNAFLRDLALGMNVIYRVKTTVGGSFDPITETMISGTEIDTDTTYIKAALEIGIRQLSEGSKEGLSIVAGHTLVDFQIGATRMLRMHPRVPLNAEARYILDGEVYKISKVLANIHIGPLPCWNEVLLVKA